MCVCVGGGDMEVGGEVDYILINPFVDIYPVV